ncbi:hypothetical protein JANAI62_21720 [Jannaschia pagri]|uniref:Uncharacterized protein n=1 Tax=Jannaschia pagri TaxID=2829797 RepID=A0ABQ4NMT7_9RHOB|nr:hypothetical protein JANAI61_21730 [Jannaschia sp. AI_61]GIT95549.1 hypothetical protein JANAI62_21720 [Jannaschia sp. AI_62]
METDAARLRAHRAATAPGDPAPDLLRGPDWLPSKINKLRSRSNGHPVSNKENEL